MRTRVYALFLFFSLLLLTYPGNGEYQRVIAFQEERFTRKPEPIPTPSLSPRPIIATTDYPPLSAYAAYVVDFPSMMPVLSINTQQSLYPASTTKIITALVAYELFSPTDIITVQTPRVEGQTMGLIADERISVENLLYGILIHSGNDAAYALADAYGYDAFVEQMNQKARELGMKNSHFTNPAGFDNPGQKTTAFDLTLASRALLENPYLKKMVSVKEIIISDEDYKVFHTLSNVNRLLGEVQGIGGLKTGYTEFAGENLVSLYKTNGHEFIIVILKSLDRFEDTRQMVNWINQNVRFID